MTKALNNPDPFAAIRRKQNQRGLSLYPTLKRHVEEADDPLQTAVKLAIIGNAIDLMVSDRPPEEENTFPALLRQSLPEGFLAALRKKLAHCRFLVYLGDNAGEIVFDKVLLETIRELYQPRVVYVVRSAPALNDALLSDAEMVKMEEVATVLANGLEAPVPGTILSRCSSELRNLIREADLVISKGGGNFDTLDEEKDLPAPVSFMLLSKCLPYCQRFKTGRFQPILANTFSD
jgi:hypothetical protein